MHRHVRATKEYPCVFIIESTWPTGRPDPYANNVQISANIRPPVYINKEGREAGRAEVLDSGRGKYEAKGRETMYIAYILYILYIRYIYVYIIPIYNIRVYPLAMGDVKNKLRAFHPDVLPLYLHRKAISCLTVSSPGHLAIFGVKNQIKRAPYIIMCIYLAVCTLDVNLYRRKRSLLLLP